MGVIKLAAKNEWQARPRQLFGRGCYCRFRSTASICPIQPKLKKRQTSSDAQPAPTPGPTKTQTQPTAIQDPPITRLRALQPARTSEHPLKQPSVCKQGLKPHLRSGGRAQSTSTEKRGAQSPHPPKRSARSEHGNAAQAALPSNRKTPITEPTSQKERATKHLRGSLRTPG